MDRKEQLLEIVKKSGLENDIKASQLVDEIIFIESQLIELKRLPFIKVNPSNTSQQKATPAAKLYKEMMQQYNNSLRLLFRLCGDLSGDSEEESPLRKWASEKNG